MISISLSKVCSHYWSIFSHKCDFLFSQKNDIYSFFKFSKIYEDLLICKAKISLNSLKLKVYKESEAKRSFPPVIEFKKISWSWQGCCRWCKNSNLISVGTNPKNSNFEHSNFGMSELRTSRTYFKKYKSNSNFKGRTSNFYKDEYIMILRHFIRKFLKIYFSVVNSRKMLPWFLSHFLEVIKIFATQNEGRNISV